MIVDYDKKGIEKIGEYLSYPLSQMTNFWHLLGMAIDQDTQVTFRLTGARGGNNRWRDYSTLTLHPSWYAKSSRFPEYKGKHYNPDIWNRRLGTDGVKSRRYSPNSQLLRASGQFRQSFKIQNMKRNELKYGTVHDKAEDIIGARPVLFVNPQDERRYGRMFTEFLKRYYRTKK